MKVEGTFDLSSIDADGCYMQCRNYFNKQPESPVPYNLVAEAERNMDSFRSVFRRRDVIFERLTG